MLRHPLIRVETGVDYESARERVQSDYTVYTGPIDAYFGYRYGKLPYRSLHFEHEHLPGVARKQPVGTVNYPNRHAFTRITEFKYLTGQEHSGTSIVREYPRSEGDPYYPIPRPDNEELYQRYKVLADAERNTIFVGRLAQYRYYNMDQVVAAALKAVEPLIQQMKNTAVGAGQR
jgi:UDP-galactopyranose mutase